MNMWGQRNSCDFGKNVLTESEYGVLNVLDVMTAVNVKMAKRKIILNIVSVIVLGICFIFASISTNAADRGPKRVLYLSSYSYAWDAVQEQIAGVQKELPEDEFFLDYEFMDTKKVGDEQALNNFYQSFSHKMQNITGGYDLVIAGDDAALQFILQHRDEWFSKMPVVFEGVNSEALIEQAREDELITGISQEYSLKENVELGKKIFPYAERVVVILDGTLTGLAERENVVACEKYFPDLQFEIISSSELTEKEIIHELKILRDDDIVIYIGMSENSEGRKYSDNESINMLTKNCDAPIIRMLDTGLERGLLGGYVLSMEQLGQDAGKMAKEILNGKNISKVSERKCSYIYRINEKVALDHKIDLKVFPAGTHFFNHKQNFFERNEVLMKKVLPLFIVFLVVLGIIIWDNLKKRKIMKELKEARNIMENASHHDFLTGLPNRSKFVSDLQELMNANKPCTVLMLDIDDFKHINDNLGHGAGDDALREIAARMKAIQTNILTPYRYAGDEFIMILRSEQQNLIEKTAFASREVFKDQIMLAGEKRTVTGSIGIATFPKDADSMELLITCADDAMYEVKKSGKNKFSYYKGPRKESAEKENK